jgi:hypothetical protein
VLEAHAVSPRGRGRGEPLLSELRGLQEEMEAISRSLTGRPPATSGSTSSSTAPSPGKRVEARAGGAAADLESDPRAAAAPLLGRRYADATEDRAAYADHHAILDALAARNPDRAPGDARAPFRPARPAPRQPAGARGTGLSPPTDDSDAIREDDMIRSTTRAATAALAILSGLPALAQEGPTIHLLNPFVQDEFWQGCSAGARRAAEATGATITELDANNLAQTQANQIDVAIQQAPDAILISPLDSNAVVPQLTRAMEGGTEVYAFNTAAPNATLTATVAMDEVATGAAAAAEMARLLRRARPRRGRPSSGSCTSSARRRPRRCGCAATASIRPSPSPSKGSPSRWRRW